MRVRTPIAQALLQDAGRFGGADIALRDGNGTPATNRNYAVRTGALVGGAAVGATADAHAKTAHVLDEIQHVAYTVDA